MIVSELKLYNFRRFLSVDGNPGLHVRFHKGLNALIGENDSGKTAVIDALKLLLLTESNEYIRPTDDDFYSDEIETTTEFRIDCTLSDFSTNEAKNFIEYLNFEKDGEWIRYYLQLHYRARKKGARIVQELRAGDIDDGIALDENARNLLRTVYLKPLRDAEREMNSGRNSRISQILINHPAIKNNAEDHQLLQIFRDANSNIERYFTVDENGKQILQVIRENLAEFNDQGQPSEAKLRTSDIQLKAILESLSLNAAEIHPGLGELNLLFIAAELLLLKDDNDGGLKLALIEELEAHLHPQAQLRLISYLQNEYSENNVQIIISTHSPVLASKINLNNIILLKNGHGYDLTDGSTGLEKGDYLFLQRFLDSTKANLFFAKGIIMVEGDAENILIPVISDIIGYPLEKYGISIVNVGSTAFLRYSRIMVRADGSTIGIPVSVVTDCDIRLYEISYETKEKVFCEKPYESEAAVEDKTQKHSVGSVRGFVSPQWTLEYCIALSTLSDDFHKAIHYGKKIYNAQNHIGLTLQKIEEADRDSAREQLEWSDLPNPEKAFKIFSVMLNSDGSSSLKAIVAQCFAAMLKWQTSQIPDGYTREKMFDLELYGFKTDEDKKAELKRKIEGDQYLKYIVDAIKYATGQDI